MGFFDTMFEKVEQKKKEKEERERVDRETIRLSLKTVAITDAVCKSFQPGGFCFQKLCDRNIMNFRIKVFKDGIISESFYRKKVNDALYGRDLLIRFSDIALDNLKSNAMANELQIIILEELKKVPGISIDKEENISLIKGTW